MSVCPHCGAASAEPDVIVEDKGPETAEAAGAAEVEVARVEAERDVKIAQIAARTIDPETEAELARLRARNEVLEAAAASQLAPVGAPIVVADPDPDPEPEPEPEPETPPPPAAEPVETGPPPETSGRSGWWAGYR